MRRWRLPPFSSNAGDIDAVETVSAPYFIDSVERIWEKKKIIEKIQQILYVALGRAKRSMVLWFFFYFERKESMRTNQFNHNSFLNMYSMCMALILFVFHPHRAIIIISFLLASLILKTEKAKLNMAECYKIYFWYGVFVFTQMVVIGCAVSSSSLSLFFNLYYGHPIRKNT